MGSNSLKSQMVEGVVLFEIAGYFAAEAGRQLDEEIDGQLRQGKTVYVLDFTQCSIVSSPGVAALMEICLKVTEDFKGKVVICGLDQLKTNVFTMAGIVSVAPPQPTRKEAIEAAKGRD